MSDSIEFTNCYAERSIEADEAHAALRDRLTALETENARLKAFVAVGREMANHFEKPFDSETYWDWSIKMKQNVAKWRALEG